MPISKTPADDMMHALASATEQLSTISATPRLDAELLMAHAIGISREALLLNSLDGPVPAKFDSLLARRTAHEPVAYILGTRAFWTIELLVTPAVLIPRADSETLIEAAVEHFGTRGPRTVLDLGTGSGALLLAALDQWPAARGIGIDASPDAVEIATRNAVQLGMAGRAKMQRGGWEGTGEAFDLILCNPPYVAASDELPREVHDHEPASALFAGPDGLDDYRRLVPLLRSQIAPRGMAAIEIGASQAGAVGALLAAEGLDAAVRRDLAGRDRCLVIHR